MDYAADHDITLIANLNKLKKVPFKKPDNTIMVDYMSMRAITAIIEQPDINTPKGLRDRFFIMLLYDTGARVQEVLNLKLICMGINLSGFKLRVSKPLGYKCQIHAFLI